MSGRPRRGAHPEHRSWLVPVSLTAVGVIVFLDWLTPAGIVVGILLGLPIIATALSDDRRATWVVTGTASIGFLAAALFGREPISPSVVWAPNRILAFLTLPASLQIAVLLQRARMQTYIEREKAAQASDLNRLLMALLAHDMRSPLSMAVQALEYVRTAGDSDADADSNLLSDVQQRLRRGLSAIDRTLAMAPTETDGPTGVSEQIRSGRDLLADLEEEARSFESEAVARGKTIDVRFSSEPDGMFRTDPLLARQALAILVDNAVRHAVPGFIRITGELEGHQLRVMVADDGPKSTGPQSGTGGSGIGLALCRAMINRAGGDIAKVEGEAGTSLILSLPLVPA